VRAFSNEVMEMIGRNMARVAEGVASGFGARANTDFRIIFPPTINDPAEAEFAAGICAELVGAENVKRDPALIMASEDFAFMLNAVPGCYINIGNGDGEGACEVHNPSYDFNDRALPWGASFFARLVEKRLARPR
jgi:metal-dependent amidase/aminoacylase/carboxypeptidase family protein